MIDSIQIQLWVGIKITGLVVEETPKTLCPGESFNLSLSVPPVFFFFRLSPANFPKIAPEVYVGEGNHEVTQPGNTWCSMVIILLQLITKQTMVDDILHALVLGFIGLCILYVDLFVTIINSVLFFIFCSINRAHKTGILMIPQLHTLLNST